MIRRRQFLGCLALAALSPAVFAETPPRPIRVGLTPAFLHDEHGVLNEWRQYMEQHLGRPVEFIQRDSYRETMDFLRLQKIDFAWICDYPYVHLRKLVRLLAVPIYRGHPLYQSYLIVPARDVHTNSILQLKGRVFAYADPYSNSGYLVPRFKLKQAGEDPSRFFRKTFFTYSHRKLVEAVSVGLAEGAAVDSYVWDMLDRIEPAITRGTRIADRSPSYGFPPLVAHRAVNDADFKAMQDLLLGMERNPEGQRLLRTLSLDGFSPGKDALYDSVAKMMRVFGED